MLLTLRSTHRQLLLHITKYNQWKDAMWLNGVLGPVLIPKFKKQLACVESSFMPVERVRLSISPSLLLHQRYKDNPL